jgi:hypothetical protein
MRIERKPKVPLKQLRKHYQLSCWSLYRNVINH